MTVRITSMTDEETSRITAADDGAALGTLRTERGNLPLDRIHLRANIIGLISDAELTQDFVNGFDVPLEASYVFPLPDGSAVTGMRITVGAGAVEAELQEREAARHAYDEANDSGRHVSIAEEDRPDVFTMRVGNILPGEKVSIAVTLVTPLAYADGQATFRFPLVVAPRYIPGSPLPGASVGDGYADDTEAVPDASRITPPLLLPGFKHPVPLTIDVGIDPAGLTLSEVRSNLPTVHTDDGRIRVQHGQRADRDFVLRLDYGADGLTDSLVLVPDAHGAEGTYQLTVLPPVSTTPPRPRDVVLLLDSSSSMDGWKMLAARRAAARIVDTLSGEDRFAVLTFDDRIERPVGLPDGLVEASDRNRYRAVEYLARVEAHGDTELFSPLRRALDLLTGGEGRDAVIVIVTDGQVGNEDQLLRGLSSDLRRVRLHAIGIDQAVNAGLLGRLASIGGGRCELVESEDRLDEAMAGIQRRIGAPLAHSLSVHAEGLAIVDDSSSPPRLPELLAEVPLVLTGRYRGGATGSLTLRGKTPAGEEWSTTVAGQRRDAAAVTVQWARMHLRDLEDRYALAGTDELAKRIVDTSLRFGVLCRFTAYLAVDSRVVSKGELRHRVLQPVELPAGWGHYPTKHDAVPGHPREAKTVKLRNVIAVALATALLVGCGWIWSLSKDGPAGTHDGAVAGKLTEPADASLPQTKGGISESPPPSSGITDEIAKAPLPQTPPATVARDVITTGSLQLVVTEPAQVADRLVSAASEAGGRVDSRSERSGSPLQSGSPVVDLVLRIPSDKLDGVLAETKKLGVVRSMSIGHTDVTSQRVDLDARIEALQTSVNRLLQLMSRADNTADLLAAESSLTQRQAELDSLRAQRATLGDQVTYATINVNISAQPAMTPRTGFLGALEHGWQSVLSTAHGALLTVGFLIPWLPVLTVLVLALVVVLRRSGYATRASRGGLE